MLVRVLQTAHNQKANKSKMGNALRSLDEDVAMVCTQQPEPIASPSSLNNIADVKSLLQQNLDPSFCTLLIAKILTTPFASLLECTYKLGADKVLVEFAFDLMLDYYMGSILCERIFLDKTMFRIDGTVNNGSPLHIVFKHDVVVDPFDVGVVMKQTNDFSLLLECSQLYSTICVPVTDAVTFWRQHPHLLSQQQRVTEFATRMQGQTEFSLLVTAYDFNKLASHTVIKLKQPLQLDMDRFQFSVYKIHVQGRFTKIDLSEDGTRFISYCATQAELRVPSTMGKTELKSFFQSKLSLDEMQALIKQSNSGDVFYRMLITFDHEMNKFAFAVKK